MKPDDLNMWVNGVPESVIMITKHAGRIKIQTPGGVDYSFDIAVLKQILNAKTKD